MEADGRGQDSRVDTRGETCREIHHRQRICGNEYETHILVDFAACSVEIRELFNDVSDLNRISCVYNWNTVSS